MILHRGNYEELGPELAAHFGHIPHARLRYPGLLLIDEIVVRRQIFEVMSKYLKQPFGLNRPSSSTCSSTCPLSILHSKKRMI